MQEDEIKNILGGLSARLSDIERIHEDNLIKQYDEAKSTSNFIKKMDKRHSRILKTIFAMGTVLISIQAFMLYLHLSAVAEAFKF